MADGKGVDVQESPKPAPRPVPRLARLTVGALSAVLLGWSLVGIGLAGFAADTPVWTLLGFEVVVLIAAALGLTLGLGHYREAPALAVACVAGTLLVASFLGYRGTPGSVGAVPLQLWLMARLAVGLLLAFIAALLVLCRNRKSWAALSTGIALGALPAAVLLMFGLAILGFGRPAPAIPSTPPSSGATQSPVADAAPATREPVWLDSSVRKFMSLGLFKPAKGGKESGRVVLLTLLGIVMIGLTSAGTHYVIRAFQLGALSDALPPASPSSPKPAAAAPA